MASASTGPVAVIVEDADDETPRSPITESFPEKPMPPSRIPAPKVPTPSQRATEYVKPKSRPKRHPHQTASPAPSLPTADPRSSHHHHHHHHHHQHQAANGPNTVLDAEVGASPSLSRSLQAVPKPSPPANPDHLMKHLPEQNRRYPADRSIATGAQRENTAQEVLAQLAEDPNIVAYLAKQRQQKARQGQNIPERQHGQPGRAQQSPATTHSRQNSAVAEGANQTLSGVAALQDLVTQLQGLGLIPAQSAANQTPAQGYGKPGYLPGVGQGTQIQQSPLAHMAPGVGSPVFPSLNTATGQTSGLTHPSPQASYNIPGQSSGSHPMLQNIANPSQPFNLNPVTNVTNSSGHANPSISMGHEPNYLAEATLNHQHQHQVESKTVTGTPNQIQQHKQPNTIQKSPEPAFGLVDPTAETIKPLPQAQALFQPGKVLPANAQFISSCHQCIPDTASEGLLFLRHFLPLFTTLQHRMVDSELAGLLADNGAYAIAGSPERSKNHLLAYFQSRCHELRELDEVVHCAWDITKAAEVAGETGAEAEEKKKVDGGNGGDPGERTIIYESTVTCRTVDDPENFKMEARGLSILELVPCDSSAATGKGFRGLLVARARTYHDLSRLEGRIQVLLGRWYWLRYCCRGFWCCCCS